MMKILLIILFLMIFGLGINFSQSIQINYFHQDPPGLEPKVFAPGIISVDNKNTHALMYSPDGRMLIFSRYPDKESYIMYYDKYNWKDAVKAPFKGKEVSFSSNGDTLYYYVYDDIYFVIIDKETFSQPVKLGDNINTEGLTEYFPSMTNSGNLYFSRDGKWDKGRILVSQNRKGKWSTPLDLGDKINQGGALHAFVDKNEQYMLFNSPRKGSYTKLDIWISFRSASNQWREPVNLGPEINGEADALVCPTVSPDGKYMFFTKLIFSDSGPPTGKIYWISTEILDKIYKNR